MLERRPQRARRLDDRRPRGRARTSRARLGARDRAVRAARRRATRPIGVIAAHDKLGAPIRASPTTTCGWPRRSPIAPRSPSTSRSAWRATRCGASSPAQELERRRLARELHDETGQALTSILLGLTAVEEPGDGRGRARGRRRRCASSSSTTLQDVRRLAVELRPKALDDFGLVPALERLTRDVRASRRDRRRPRRAARRGAAAGRGRDGALPHRAGGADERGQARATHATSASCSTRNDGIGDGA